MKWAYVAGLILLLACGSCADVEQSGVKHETSTTAIDVPGTAIENRSTLAYAVGQLRVHAQSRYHCAALRISNARRLTSVTSKVEFAEEWEADVCGSRKLFILSFMHDMTGGTVLFIRE